MKLPNAAVRRVQDCVRRAMVGDPRRVRRLKRVVGRLAKRPRVSLPEAMGTEAELEGAYRLINNAHVTMDRVQAAHAEETARRARSAHEVLAIHDTTPCQLAHADPTEVGYLSTGKPGFYAHYTLIVAAESRHPLGVAYLESVFRAKPPRKRARRKRKTPNQSGAVTRRKPNREFERWGRGIEQSEACLRGCSVIHVADRESDSYELMSRCLSAGTRFVFRSRIGTRNARSLVGGKGALSTLIGSQQGVLTREVALSTRKPRSAPRQSKAHPPRHARLATLHFAAERLDLERPRYLGGAFPETLAVNVVRVWEPQPPPGERPVEWLLFTTEPIDTPAQIGAVVDTYRARWLIEECNKALKTGCLYEHRQFESRQALLTTLALSLPIACELLSLRGAARVASDHPGAHTLNPLQIRVLRRLGSRSLSAVPTAREVMLAVAGLGGHQRSNGDPGWLVLQRGLTRLLDYEVGWRAALVSAQDL